VSVEIVSVVYECPNCEERLGGRRCPECNVFWRRLSPGGGCPACGEIVLADELEVEW
jgi:hypothetical protein